jgi:hypothetical protein
MPTIGWFKVMPSPHKTADEILDSQAGYCAWPDIARDLRMRTLGNVHPIVGHPVIGEPENRWGNPWRPLRCSQARGSGA